MAQDRKLNVSEKTKFINQQYSQEEQEALDLYLQSEKLLSATVKTPTDDLFIITSDDSKILELLMNDVARDCSTNLETIEKCTTPKKAVYASRGANGCSPNGGIGHGYAALNPCADNSTPVHQYFQQCLIDTMRNTCNDPPVDELTSWVILGAVLCGVLVVIPSVGCIIKQYFFNNPQDEHKNGDNKQDNRDEKKESLLAKDEKTPAEAARSPKKADSAPLSLPHDNKKLEPITDLQDVYITIDDKKEYEPIADLNEPNANLENVYEPLEQEGVPFGTQPNSIQAPPSAPSIDHLEAVINTSDEGVSYGSLPISNQSVVINASAPGIVGEFSPPKDNQLEKAIIEDILDELEPGSSISASNVSSAASAISIAPNAALFSSASSGPKKDVVIDINELEEKKKQKRVLVLQ